MNLNLNDFGSQPRHETTTVFPSSYRRDDPGLILFLPRGDRERAYCLPPPGYSILPPAAVRAGRELLPQVPVALPLPGGDAPHPGPLLHPGVHTPWGPHALPAQGILPEWMHLHKGIPDPCPRASYEITEVQADK